MTERRSGDPRQAMPRPRSALASAPSRDTASRVIASSTKLVGSGAPERKKRGGSGHSTLTQTQAEALTLFRNVGEIRHAIASRARLVSGARLIVGESPAPGSTATEDGTPARDRSGTVVDGLDEKLVSAAETVLASVVDNLGTQAGLIAAIAQLWDTIGECSLVAWWETIDGRPVSEDDRLRDHVRWEVVSPDAYVEKSGKATLVLASNGTDTIEMPKDHQVWRLWLRDVARPSDPWSWLMSAIPIARSVDALTREQLSSALASALGKIQLVPSQAAPQVQTVGEGDHPVAVLRTQTPDEFAVSIDGVIGDAMTAVMDDSMSGAGVVAAVVAVDADYIDKFGHAIDLSRTPDPGVSEALAMSLQRLRESADVSPEMLAGLGDTNRWNGVQVTAEEYKRYHRPLLAAIAASFTSELLWPSLVALGINPEDARKVRVIVDPGPIIADPDTTAIASEALTLGAIGYDGYLQLTGIDPTLAATPEDREIIRAFLNAKAGRGNSAPSGAAPTVDQTVGSARRVASTSARLPDVEALAAIEDRLVSDLAAAASMAVENAVSRSYSVLRNRARSAGIALPSSGPLTSSQILAVRSAAFADEDEADEVMILAALALLRGPHDAYLTEAMAAMLAMWGITMPTEDAPVSTSPWTGAAIDLDTIEQTREASWAALAGGLLAWVNRRLSGQVVDTIEKVFERAASVPRTIIRRAMSAAGGTPTTPGPEGIRPRSGSIVVNTPGDGSLVFGPRFQILMPQITGWTWHYGTPATRVAPFEPHLALSGLSVSGPEDDGLNSPEWGGYWPGDHAGCQCILLPTYEGTP